MEKLTAKYERRRERDWLAWIEGDPKITITARSLWSARESIRDAAATKRRRNLEVVDTYVLHEHAREAVDAANAARAAAQIATEEATRAATTAVDALVNDGLSLRDTAAVLGISHTRAQQLLRNST